MTSLFMPEAPGGDSTKLSFDGEAVAGDPVESDETLKAE
jgi:hypothetical protein